jgi:DNA-binding transcriptional MocR family regulator
MLLSLERYFPDAIAWTIPKGGFFLWAHFPDYLPIQEICREALAQNLLVANGTAFFWVVAIPQCVSIFLISQKRLKKGLKFLVDY